MTNKKSIFFICLGVLLLIGAVSSIFIDIPDAINNYRYLRQLTITAASKLETVQQASTTALPTSLIPSLRETLTPTRKVPASLTPLPIVGYIPDRISIPAIHLDAPIISAEMKAVTIRDQWFEQWIVPNERAGGWLTNSAPLGVVGNTVIGGHHNEYGKVFGHLVELKVGDSIYLYSGEKLFVYQVVETQLLPEKDVSLEIRKANAVWISPTDDERVTLVTCWPKRNNTHRVIIVAKPVVNQEK